MKVREYKVRTRGTATDFPKTAVRGYRYDGQRVYLDMP
jgi:hypothetical protein